MSGSEIFPIVEPNHHPHATFLIAQKCIFEGMAWACTTRAATLGVAYEVGCGVVLNEHIFILLVPFEHEGVHHT